MKDNTIFERQINVFTDVKIGMYYCGKRVRSINHTYGPRIGQCYMFVLVNEGEATLYHKNGEITLKAHDLLVMCPGEKIHYKAHTPWSIQWAGLYGKTVEVRLLSYKRGERKFSSLDELKEQLSRDKE